MTLAALPKTPKPLRPRAFFADAPGPTDISSAEDECCGLGAPLEAGWALDKQN